MTTPNAAAFAADYIAKLNWALVPIPPGSKAPNSLGWNQAGNAFTDPTQALLHWRNYPDQNMGLLLGASGMVTLDIDHTRYTKMLFAELGWDYETLLAHAPRLIGNPERDKALFRAPAGITLDKKALAWPGQNGGKPITIFELRGGPNQDLLPPSIHPSGRPYEWRRSPFEGIPELPAELLTLWRDWPRLRGRLEAICPWAPEPKPTPQARPAVATRTPGESVIAAFNAAHDLRVLLEAHGYRKKGQRYCAPSSESGIPGVVLLDDGKACFSHHGADPLANGHSHDTFDVYRLLDHGGDWKAAVKAAAQVLGIAEPARKRSSKQRQGGEQAPAAYGDWRDQLTINKEGAVRTNLFNIVLILTHDPQWQGVLRYDVFRQRIVKAKPLPFEAPTDPDWSDTDDSRTTLWLTRKYQLSPPTKLVTEAVQVRAEASSFHPVRDYLATLQWDGKPRVNKWLTRYLGATDSPHARLVGRCWLVAAVARVMDPGCKMDSVLILEGRQGIGKSQALGVLAGEWFSDTPFEIGSKDSFVQLVGNWIVELAELDSFNRAESSRAKYFFASREDTYRPPWGRRAIKVPRQCVFAGTVNGDTYLKDETGNRRYWPVTCATVQIDALRRERDQLWAEALTLYRSGEPWWFDATLDYVVEEQEKRYEADPWEAVIIDGLQLLMPHEREAITSTHVLYHILEIPKERLKRADQMRVGNILRRLGYERRKLRVSNETEAKRFGAPVGATLWGYGK